MLVSHDEGLHPIGLFEQLQQHVKPLDIDVEGAVRHHIDHRREVQMVAFHGCLKVVELSLCRIVAVVTEHSTHGHSHLMGLGEVEGTAGVRDSGSRSSHDIYKIKVIPLVYRGPVYGVLILRNQYA